MSERYLITFWPTTGDTYGQSGLSRPLLASLLAAGLWLAAGPVEAQEAGERLSPDLKPTTPRLRLPADFDAAEPVATSQKENETATDQATPRTSGSEGSAESSATATPASGADGASEQPDPTVMDSEGVLRDESIRAAIKRFLPQSPEVQKSDLVERAKRKSRRTVGEFIKALRSPSEDQADFAFKKTFEEEGVRESIWFQAMGWDEKSQRLLGRADNAPTLLKKVNKGDIMRVDPEEIDDWMFIEGIRLVGGNSLRVELWDGPKAERYAFEDRMGFIVSRFFDDQDPGMWEQVTVGRPDIVSDIPRDFFRGLEPNGMRWIQPSNGSAIMVHFQVIDRGGPGVETPVAEAYIRSQAQARKVQLQSIKDKVYFSLANRQEHDGEKFLIKFWQVGFGQTQIQISATVKADRASSREVKRVFDLMPRIIAGIRVKDAALAKKVRQNLQQPAKIPEPPKPGPSQVVRAQSSVVVRGPNGIINPQQQPKVKIERKSPKVPMSPPPGTKPALPVSP